MALSWAHGIEPKELPGDLLSAPTKLEVGAETLTIESRGYFDRMPRIIVPGQEIDCARVGPFIVLITLNVRALPKNTAIERLWVHSEGKWWSGSFDAGSTRLEGNRLVMISRGCPVRTLTPGMSADVIVEVRHERTRKYLRAPAKPLGAVY